MWIFEQWRQQTPLISAFVFCVLNTVPHPPEMWASSGVPGAISPLPLSSLAVSAKSLLQKSGLSDQHRRKHNGAGPLGDFAHGGDGFNTFNRTQSQHQHFCTESTRSPAHGKTTVRWYSQLATPWELAVSHANGDQCTDRWICFSPKLLIIWMIAVRRAL